MKLGVHGLATLVPLASTRTPPVHKRMHTRTNVATKINQSTYQSPYVIHYWAEYPCSVNARTQRKPFAMTATSVTHLGLCTQRCTHAVRHAPLHVLLAPLHHTPRHQSDPHAHQTRTTVTTPRLVTPLRTSATPPRTTVTSPRTSVTHNSHTSTHNSHNPTHKSHAPCPTQYYNLQSSYYIPSTEYSAMLCITVPHATCTNFARIPHPTDTTKCCLTSKDSSKSRTHPLTSQTLDRCTLLRWYCAHTVHPAMNTHSHTFTFSRAVMTKTQHTPLHIHYHTPSHSPALS